MQFVTGPNLPIPAGHYSPAVIHQGIVYVSGQIAKVPNRPEFIPATIEEQTLQTLANIEAILIAAGSRKDLVLRATLYIPDMGLWAQVNQAYSQFFGSHEPARSVVPVGKFRDGFLIEIDVIAAMDDSR